MFSISLNSRSPGQTQEIAYLLAQGAQEGDVYCLCGGLAVGKTVFAQGFVARFAECTTSPSFVIVQEYASRPRLFHIDLYRLSSQREAEDIGIEDYLNAQGICLVEWPGVIEELMTLRTVWVYFSVQNADTRSIRFEVRRSETGSDSWADARIRSILLAFGEYEDAEISYDEDRVCI